MTLTAASLCTGIGGLDLGVLSVLDAEYMWHSEIDGRLSPIAHQAIGDVPNIGDFTTVDWSTVPPVDVLTAGYPCQPFSQAGHRKGTNDSRHLWPHIAEAVRVLRPRLVVLENVAAHLSLGFGDVLGGLAEAGFDAEWCVLRASDVGACHHRARLFIVAAPADADPCPTRRQRPNVRRPEDRCRDHAAGDGPGDGGWTPAQWGPFWSAVARWSDVLGRDAPRPLDGSDRLDPRFVEWVMGYPPSWTDGLSRNAALEALGNAVVPQHAEAAIRLLLDGLAWTP